MERAKPHRFAIAFNQSKLSSTTLAFSIGVESSHLDLHLDKIKVGGGVFAIYKARLRFTGTISITLHVITQHINSLLSGTILIHRLPVPIYHPSSTIPSEHRTTYLQQPANSNVILHNYHHHHLYLDILTVTLSSE